MKLFFATLIASAAMITAVLASEVEGVVKAYDAATKTVMLEDGSSYVLGDGVAAEALVAGAKVKVMLDDNTKVATAVQVLAVSSYTCNCVSFSSRASANRYSLRSEGVAKQSRLRTSQVRSACGSANQDSLRNAKAPAAVLASIPTPANSATDGML